MSLGVIIQARMGSKRLPGKVMMDICGRPLLWHVIRNARKAVENVIVATPDKSIAQYAEEQGVRSFIGSEEDVLDRYYQCAVRYDVDPIIRITADNPLVDTEMVKSLIDFWHKGHYDWAANCRLKVTYPIGNDAEVFSFKSLERAWCETTDPQDNDCVTSYIYHHPEMFKLGVMTSPENLSHLRWTVDTQEDLDHVRCIFEKRLQGVELVDMLCGKV